MGFILQISAAGVRTNQFLWSKVLHALTEYNTVIGQANGIRRKFPVVYIPWNINDNKSDHRFSVVPKEGEDAAHHVSFYVHYENNPTSRNVDFFVFSYNTLTVWC